MIDVNNLVPRDYTRDLVLIHKNILDSIDQLLQTQPELAGEFAISAIETVLLGDCSTDNPLIKVMLNTTKSMAESNNAKYARSIESRRRKRMMDLKLDRIAELVKQNKTQMEIMNTINDEDVTGKKISRQTVGDRIQIIREEYPELLPEMQVS